MGDTTEYGFLLSCHPDKVTLSLGFFRSPAPETAMLSVRGRGAALCDGITRREALRVGALGVAGLSLADVLRLQAAAPADTARGKSVIMIWLRGGPSHIDSFDMKPDAPAEIRGE